MSILERAAERMAEQEKAEALAAAENAASAAPGSEPTPPAEHPNVLARAAASLAPEKATVTGTGIDATHTAEPAFTSQRRGSLERSFEPSPVPTALVTDPATGTRKVHHVDRELLAAGGLNVPNAQENNLTRQLRRIKRPLLNNARTSALNAPEVGFANVIMVTSSLPREGKTFMAANLALSISSEVDYRVVLVGADPFQYGSENILGLPRGPGLCEVLRGEMDVEDAILDTDINGFQFLPAGSDAEDLDELAASDTANMVFRQLAERDPNRIVVIDTAPVMARTEAVVLARQAGHVVMIIESRKTPRSTVKETLRQLRSHPNLMAILNKCTDRVRALDRGNYEYGYGYGYGYGSGNKNRR